MLKYSCCSTNRWSSSCSSHRYAISRWHPCSSHRWYRAQLYAVYFLLLLSVTVLLSSLQTSNCRLTSKMYLQKVNADARPTPTAGNPATLTDSQDEQPDCSYYTIKKTTRQNMRRNLWRQLVAVSEQLGTTLHTEQQAETARSILSSYSILQSLLVYLNPSHRLPTLDKTPARQRAGPVMDIADWQTRVEVPAWRGGRNMRRFSGLNVTAGPSQLLLCPEEFRGENHGYPFFHTGFDIRPCKNSTAMHKLVTVLLSFLETDGRLGNQFAILRQIEQVYPNLKVIIAAQKDTTSRFIRSLKLQNLEVFTNMTKTSSGSVWNLLVSRARTPYVLIGRQMQQFSNDSRLERLLRQLEQSDVAAGSLRTQDGHWQVGCHQVGPQSYNHGTKKCDLTYTPGYHRSARECWMCDNIDGPFIARTDLLRMIRFNDQLPASTLFLDFFRQLKQAGKVSMVCPDSMFFVRHSQTIKVGELQQLTVKWNVTCMKLPHMKYMSLPCHHSDTCDKSKHCCLQDLSNAVKFVMTTCDKIGIVCQLLGKTVVEVITMQSLRSRTATVAFLASNYSAFLSHREEFHREMYVLKEQEQPWCCVEGRITGGQFLFTSTSGWQINLIGYHGLDAENVSNTSSLPTKLLFNNQWNNAPSNPGLYARNLLGHEFYNKIF